MAPGPPGRARPTCGRTSAGRRALGRAAPRAKAAHENARRDGEDGTGSKYPAIPDGC
ncbi:MAG: hypothetical protein NTU95_04775 [Methanothrix sp.]|nr:hypothetical protein [Methanothrix sp.]